MTLRKKTNQIDESPHREEIVADIVRRVPARTIAQRYRVSQWAVERYTKKIPEERRVAAVAEKLRPGYDLEMLKKEEGEGLLLRLRNQRLRLLQTQDMAFSQERFTAVADLSAQIHKNEELVCKYLGLLVTHAKVEHTHVSLVMSSEYVALRGALMQALRPFPEARAAVALAIQQIEAGATGQPPMIEGSAHVA